jgi:hypothetical protein
MEARAGTAAVFSWNALSSAVSASKRLSCAAVALSVQLLLLGAVLCSPGWRSCRWCTRAVAEQAVFGAGSCQACTGAGAHRERFRLLLERGAVVDECGRSGPHVLLVHRAAGLTALA